MTWVAFDRGIKSAEKFGFKAPLEKWRALRDTIHRDVCEKGFDRELNSFVESYGSKLLDASILLLPSVGFLPPSDPARARHARGDRTAPDAGRLCAAARSARSLTDEKQPIEGAFLACSLWLADAYVLTGEFDKAQALFDRVVAIANDLGLLAEEFDTGGRPPDRQFPAGADPHRADQHRA